MLGKGVQIAWNGIAGLVFLGILAATMVVKTVIEKR